MGSEPRAEETLSIKKYLKIAQTSASPLLNQFVRRRKKCGRKEKQEYNIGQNLSLCRRKNEKRSVRRKSLLYLNDNDPDKLCAHAHTDNL